MEQLILRYGPLAVLLGAAVEYDTTLILAGVVVHLGLIKGPVAVVCGAVGALLGDTVCYVLGRRGGAALRQWEGYRRVGPVIERLVARVGPWQIVLARLIYGIRFASMFFWGIHGLPYPKFVALDLLGTTLGAVVLVALGFALSGSAQALLGRVKAIEIWMLGALGAAVAVAIVHRLIERHIRGARGSTS